MTTARLLTSIWIAVLAIGSVVVMVRNGRRVTGDAVLQLVQLVRQAHTGEAFRTAFDIRVSPEMRDALCLPLTPEQLTMMRAAGEGVFSTSVSCYLVSGKLRSGELSGVVMTTVQVHSRYSRSAFSFPAAKLRIVVRHNGRQYPNGEWAVTSVEQIA